MSKEMTRIQPIATGLLAVVFCLGFGSASSAQQCDQTELFVSDNTNGNVYTLPIDGGSATRTVTVPGTDFQGVAFDPVSGDLYVADNLGALWQIPAGGTPTPAAIGGAFNAPLDVKLSADRDTAYVAEFGANQVRAVPLAAGGFTFADPAVGVTGLTVGSTQGFANLSSAGQVASFVLDAAAIPLAFPLTPALPANQLVSVAISPSERLVYATTAAGNLHRIDVNLLTNTVVATGLGGTARVALDQTGRFAYVTDASGGINKLDLNSLPPMTVTPLQAVGFLNTPQGIALSRADDPTVFISDLRADHTITNPQITVQVNITDVSGRGVTGIDADITFDTNLLGFAGGGPFGLTSGTPPGCTVNATANGGGIALRIAGCPAFEGSGPVASLTFSVPPALPTGRAALEVDNVVLTGWPSACARDGMVYSPITTISGRVDYHSSGTDIEDVTLTLEPAGLAVQTDAQGSFVIPDAPLDTNQTLTAVKNGGVLPTDISVNDTLLAMQIASGHNPSPSYMQQVAGDVTARCISWTHPTSGQPIEECVTILDAFRIHQMDHGVISDFPDRANDWAFVPNPLNPVPTRVLQNPGIGNDDQGEMRYQPLQVAAPDQLWVAVIYGDLNVSRVAAPASPAPDSSSRPGGDLQIELVRDETILLDGGAIEPPPPSAPLASTGRMVGPTLSFSEAIIQGSTATVSLIVDDATLHETFDVAIYYDAGRATATEVALTPLTEGNTWISNVDLPGEIRASVAGAFEGGGALFDITFELGDSFDASGLGLLLALGAVDEGTTSSQPVDGRICSEQNGTTPAEVQNLRVDKFEDGTIELSWDADENASSYVAYTPMNGGPPIVDLDDLGCLGRVIAPRLIMPPAALPEPDDEVLVTFLVAAENCQGVSTLGSGSNADNPRPVAPVCP